MVPGLGRAPVMATVPTVATATSSARCGSSCPTSGTGAVLPARPRRGRLTSISAASAQHQQAGGDEEPGDVQHGAGARQHGRGAEAPARREERGAGEQHERHRPAARAR